MPATHDDGGVRALAGFLYQIVGTLSLAAQISEPPDLARTQDADKEALFILQDVQTADFEAYHECFGEDAVFVNPEDETVLVQFKYSRVNRTITGTEIEEIVQKLEKAASTANRGGLKVTACALVTNRGLTSSGQRFWDDEERKDRKFKLRFVPYSMSRWEERLNEFAQQHGATAEEASEGIKKLIGMLMQETGKRYPGVSITIRDLREAFVGSSDARPLSPTNARQNSAEKLERIKNGDVGMQDPLVLRQNILNELTHLSRQNALIILSGQGGCGKTVSAWQWAYSKEFTGFTTVTDIPERWLAKELCAWAGLQSANHRWRDENWPESLDRIQRANPDYPPPIVHLALDGLDEELALRERGVIQEAINWFWGHHIETSRASEPPKAILVVTCRNLEDFKLLWQNSPTGFGTNQPIAHISVDLFSDDELAAVVRSAPSDRLDFGVRDGILAALRDHNATNRSLSESRLFTVPLPVAQAPKIRKPMLDAIHHPTILGSFLLLSREDQLGVLDNVQDALMNLAQKVVERFCYKAIRRRSVPGLQKDALIMLLSNIAIGTPIPDSNPGWHTLEKWTELATEGGSLNRVEARYLYKEALSGGLIRSNSPTEWQWCYSWVCDYLALRSAT